MPNFHAELQGSRITLTLLEQGSIEDKLDFDCYKNAGDIQVSPDKKSITFTLNSAPVCYRFLSDFFLASLPGKFRYDVNDRDNLKTQVEAIFAPMKAKLPSVGKITTQFTNESCDSPIYQVEWNEGSNVYTIKNLNTGEYGFTNVAARAWWLPQEVPFVLQEYNQKIQVPTSNKGLQALKTFVTNNQGVIKDSAALLDRINRVLGATTGFQWSTLQTWMKNIGIGQANISTNFKCPISHELMQDPIMLPSGITCDRASWLIYRGTNKPPFLCPETGLDCSQFKAENAPTNFFAKSMIDELSKQQSQANPKKILKNFECPISLEVMQDPIMLPSGITCDRQSWRGYVAANKNQGAIECPVTGKSCTGFNVETAPTNFFAKRIIDEFFQQHQDLKSKVEENYSSLKK